MNKFWRFAFDSDLESIKAYAHLLSLTGFVTGWVLKDFAAGLVYGFLTPIIVLPTLGTLAVFIGLAVELWPKKVK